MRPARSASYSPGGGGGRGALPSNRLMDGVAFSRLDGL